MEKNIKLNKYKSKYFINKLNKAYNLKYNYYKVLVEGFKSIDIKYIKTLNNFINNYNSKNPSNYIDSSHGIVHMLTVLCHTEKALQAWNCYHLLKISTEEIIKIKLAALLHDVDDSKYFPDSFDYENARFILKKANPQILEDDINEIVEMISWVSSSKNCDNIPGKVRESGKEYLLYPRYADRLEAIGIIGIKRTLEYTLKIKDKGKPNGVLFNEKTERVTDEVDLFNRVATEDRYKRYKGSSDSMIDQFYDKLLRVGNYPIRNIYFDTECKMRQQPIVDIVLKFGREPNITENKLQHIIEEYIEKSKTLDTKCLCDIEVEKYIKINLSIE